MDSDVSVDHELLTKAFQSLIRHVNAKDSSQMPNLLVPQGSQTVLLSFNLAAIPDRLNCRPLQIELPHPLYNASEVCLIVKAPQRKWKQIFANDSIANVTKIIDIEKLKKKYSTLKDRIQLCAAFDLFLCDYRIIEKMPRILGKVFISSKKLPIAIRLRDDESMKEPVEKAIRCTYMTIRRGQNVAVKIGRINFGGDKLIENAKRVIDRVSSFFKENAKWQNVVESVSVRATDTISLPLYIRPELKRQMEEALETDSARKKAKK